MSIVARKNTPSGQASVPYPHPARSVAGMVYPSRALSPPNSTPNGCSANALPSGLPHRGSHSERVLRHAEFPLLAIPESCHVSMVIS